MIDYMSKKKIITIIFLQSVDMHIPLYVLFFFLDKIMKNTLYSKTLLLVSIHRL